ncbi:serine/threonine protein kinase [Pseudomonas matsuisoli]|uniref:Serine/threonine protein kinase n=1 Tax=Pseudomonas matsuisoli TaxID=1515666 RepID=A0A917PRX8_9PSED|nr:serine/threonine-protein kinase [Pseudomonas matsuisoli]GGJ89281.1 serine/threonine protein kinase [Pseudomonas matsuisoli]
MNTHATASVDSPIAEEPDALTYYAFASEERPEAEAPKDLSTRRHIGEMPTVLAGRYRIERLLGIGGMGAVYRARDLLREQFGDPSPYLAIKTLTDDFADYPDAGALLYTEFALTTQLNHPGVIKLFEFHVDTASQRAFITLESLQGRTLDHTLKENPEGLSWETAQAITSELLAALAYSHRKGILHGDLKPSNIMLTPDGVRLFDYGLGRAQNGVLEGLPQISRDRFAAWTPRYAALELIEGGMLSEATDTYAIACVIYELCSGRHPYRRLNAKQARNMELDKQLEKPECLPEPCWKALRAALSLAASDRKIAVEGLAQAFETRRGSSLERYFGFFCR